MWYSKEWQSAYDMREPDYTQAEREERRRKYEEEYEEKMSYYKNLDLKYDIDEYTLEELKELSDKQEN